MSIFVSGVPVLTKSHFMAIGKNCKISNLQKLFIWLAREHYFSQFLDAPGGSWQLLGTPWAPMVAPGSSWRRFMKTIVLFAKTYIFHSPGLLLTFPMLYILDHWKLGNPLYCRLLEPMPESRQIKPPGTGCVGFWSQGEKVIKSDLLGMVFLFWSQGQKVIKSSFLRRVLSTS